MLVEVREDGDERAVEEGASVSSIVVEARMAEARSEVETHFMPTPPATKTTLSTLAMSIPGGGHTKLPPTRTCSSLPRISASGRQSQAAGGLDVFWIASSRYAGEMGGDADGGLAGLGVCDVGSASRGVEVMVKPPGRGKEGMCTSSHWPARNCAVEMGS